MVTLITMDFTLNDIQTNESVAREYISQLQLVLPCSLRTLIEHAQTLSSELKEFVTANKCGITARDKGSAGKMVEFYVFGRAANCDSAPDLRLGDVKATHIKKMAKGYNAKERLTITNVGATSNYGNLAHILEFGLPENPRWAKVKQGILVVLEHTEGTWSAEEKTLNEQVVALFHYDITSQEEWMSTVLADYEKIRECVRAEAVTQSGQKFLHIHPHGSKASSTRAFGFTNKFVTRLICHYTGREMIDDGRSVYFKCI